MKKIQRKFNELVDRLKDILKDIERRVKPMRTYIFVEKNGSATITLSAENATIARDYLREIVNRVGDFRLDSEEDE